MPTPEQLADIVQKMSEARRGIQSEQQPPSDPGIFWRALDYINRPYNSVMGTITEAALGNDPAVGFSKGIKGQDIYGFADLLTLGGADPESAATRWGGLGLDIFPGMFLDPLTYLSFGTNKVGTLLKAADKFPGREAAAAMGAWSPLNVSVPFTGINKSIVPKVIAKPAGKAVDASLKKMRESSIGKFFGSVFKTDKALEKEFPEFANFMKGADVDRRQALNQAFEALSVIAKTHNDPRARTLATHVLENPHLLTGESFVERIPVNKGKEVSEFTKQKIRAKADMSTAYRTVVSREIDPLRQALDNLGRSGEQIQVVDLDDLSDKLSASGGLRGSQFVDEIRNAEDPQFLEKALLTYMRQTGHGDILPESLRVYGLISSENWADIQKAQAKTSATQRARRAAIERTGVTTEGKRIYYGMSNALGQTKTGVVVFRAPLLSPELSRVNRSAALKTIDKIDAFMKSGGDVGKIMRAYVERNWGEYARAAKEIGLDPKSDNVKRIVESLHLRVWSGLLPAGNYSNDLKSLANYMLEDVAITDPAARFVWMRERIAAQMAETTRELDEIAAGKWTAPLRGVIDDPLAGNMIDKQLDAARKRAALQSSKAAIDNEIANTFPHDFDSIDEYNQAMTQLQADARAIDTDLQGLVGEVSAETRQRTAAVNMLAAERRAELVEQLDTLKQLAEDGNPLERAAYVERLLNEKIAPRIKQEVKLRTVQAGEIVVDGKTRALNAAIEPYRQATADMYMSALKAIDPNVEFPIENYVKHMLPARRQSVLQIWNAAKKSKDRIAEAKKKLAVMYKELGYDDTKMINGLVDRDLSMLDPSYARASAELGHGKMPGFIERKYPFTLHEMVQAGMDWETDIIPITMASYREASLWRFGYDMYDQAKSMGIAQRLDPIADARYIKENSLVPVNYYVPWIDPKKDPFKGMYIPQNLETLIQSRMRGGRAFTSDEGFKSLLDVGHYLRTYFSSWTLAPFPAFHIRNVASDFMNAYPGGLNIMLPDGMKSAKAGAEIVLRSKGGAPTPSLDAALKEIRGRWGNIDADGLRRFMRMEGIIDSRWTRDLDFADFLENELDNVTDRRSRWSKLMDWMPGTSPDRNKWTRGGFAVAEKTQDFAKASLFVDRMKKLARSGQQMSLEQAMVDAARHTKKYLYDYSDLSQVEKKIFKLIAPFYSWSRFNIPRQLDQLIHEPGKFGHMYRAYHGAWNGYQKDLSWEDVPDWMNDNLGIPVRKHTAADGSIKHDIFTPMGWLPASELNEVANALRGRNASLLVSKLNPFIKEPLEQMINYDTFWKDKLDRGQVRDLFGFPMNQRVAHLLMNIRMLTELDRLNPGGLWTKHGQARGFWAEERPHKYEADEFLRWIRSGTGVNVRTTEQSEELRRKSIHSRIRFQELVRDAKRANAKGQKLEAAKFMREAKTESEKAIALSKRLADVSRRQGLAQAEKGSR